MRAHVWTSGDIQLYGVNATRVMASNTTGDIFFDGEFASGGTYEFKSGQGTITLQLPVNCGLPPGRVSAREKNLHGPILE